jgi:lysozyme family protein
MRDPTFEAAVAVVLAHEGGYVNDPSDHGGETKNGISRRAYPNLDIANLTVEQAKAIYATDFWLRYRINQLPDAVAPKVLDMAVLCGPATAIRILQRALAASGCDIDGSIGPQTVAACRDAQNEALLLAYRRLLAAHFEQIAGADASQQRFLRGWVTRAMA